MRLLADVHISPVTVAHLIACGHDAVRADAHSMRTDEQIIAAALDQNRAVLTQDLDFSGLIALSGGSKPSLITLRFSSSRVEYVNELLSRVLPGLEYEVERGAVVTVTDHQVRVRALPLT